VTRCRTVLSGLMIVGLMTVGLNGAAATALSAPQSPSTKIHEPIQLTVPSGTGAIFTLDSLIGCRVGDGLLIVKNVGTRSARITGVGMDVPSAPDPTKDRTTFRILPLKPGSTTGEIATTFALTAIPQSAYAEKAVGAVLKPLAASGRWYAIIARMSVRTVHRHAWEIRAITVSLVQGTKTLRLSFPQAVRLPSDKC
jgi:hypothetical protein